MSWFGRKQRFPTIAMRHIGQCFGRSLIQINPNREQTMFPDAFAGLTAIIHLDSSKWNWPATRLLPPRPIGGPIRWRPYRGPAVGISEPFVGSSKWNLPCARINPEKGDENVI